MAAHSSRTTPMYPIITSTTAIIITVSTAMKVTHTTGMMATRQIMLLWLLGNCLISGRIELLACVFVSVHPLPVCMWVCLFRSCNNHHSNDMCKNNGSQGSGGDSNSNSGDTPRRYCLCSYCELFGRNGVSCGCGYE